MRDRSIDVSRGILVLMMVYGHVLQFFGDASLFPAVNRKVLTLLQQLYQLQIPVLFLLFPNLQNPHG